MSTNLSFSDRQIRFVIGATMIAAPLIAMPETLGMWSIVLLGAIPFITMAITGWDPFYAMLGKSTYVEGEEDIQQRSWTCPNVGTIDRGVRLGAGLMMMYALMTMSTMQAEMITTLLAIPLIVSAIIAWDPLYAMLGINSFASQIDVEAAEPEASEQTLAACYSFPQRQPASSGYPRAA
ncbi:YgaP family membrane protein [Kaarinaea lacus]